MRKSKLAHQRKPKVVHHTPAERMALRREKKRSGPCAVRRRARRRIAREEQAKLNAAVNEVRRPWPVPIDDAALENALVVEAMAVVMNQEEKP